MNKEFLRFTSPTDFLKAALEADLPKKPLSIRQLSRKLGYASDRGIGMVLKGQRPLSLEMQSRLKRFLKLTPKEQLHLHNLVRRARGDHETEVSQIPAATKDKILQGEDLHPLVPAYSLAILELVRLATKPLPVEFLRQRLRQKMTRRELERTLEALADVNLIKRGENGCYRALEAGEYVSSTLDIPSTMIRQIHRRQLARAAQTLDEQMLSEREFIAKTLTVRSDQLGQIKRRLREKLEELAEEIAGGQSLDDAIVVQLNLQFYLQG